MSTLSDYGSFIYFTKLIVTRFISENRSMILTINIVNINWSNSYK
ncbi:hypothetical protein PROSTU_02154 [Providencia stuartii ATCC 25827]|uniref:Uncharacterized protein n=1 Tax=Providencia stuartii ATCC 25827 TaxID=471874 RepID=A0AA86YKU9_PROST|nr:hypothetical protein PROSTU_02154 [Providencia stuartii ATCC 25827]